MQYVTYCGLTDIRCHLGSSVMVTNWTSQKFKKLVQFINIDSSLLIEVVLCFTGVNQLLVE